jgi:hypothetical protein
MYNLRLPDGNSKGTGYPRTGYTSLKLLLSEQVPSIQSLNSSGAGIKYNLNNLKEVLSKIILIESEFSKRKTFHLMEDNDIINPNDHADHKAATEIFQKVLNSQSVSGCIVINKFTTYVNGNKPINLSPQDYLKHRQMWEAVDHQLVSDQYNSVFDKYHTSWLGKQYRSTQLENEFCD